MTGIIITVVIVAAALLFFMHRKLAADSCKANRRGCIVIPCTADTEDLERLVKAYYWEEVFETEDYARRILLVQMEKSENYYTAKMLEQKYSIVSCVDISELAEYLKKNELKCFDRREVNGKT